MCKLRRRNKNEGRGRKERRKGNRGDDEGTKKQSFHFRLLVGDEDKNKREKRHNRKGRKERDVNNVVA